LKEEEVSFQRVKFLDKNSIKKVEPECPTSAPLGQLKGGKTRSQFNIITTWGWVKENRIPTAIHEIFHGKEGGKN